MRFLLYVFGGAMFFAWLARMASQSPESLSLQEARSILGVGADADASDIKRAHRALIKESHPDSGGDAAYAAKLNRARDVLLKG